MTTIIVKYRSLRDDVIHTEQCGDEEHAVQLMNHINRASDLKGIDVDGLSKYICGMSGMFYVRNSYVRKGEDMR